MPDTTETTDAAGSTVGKNTEKPGTQVTIDLPPLSTDPRVLIFGSIVLGLLLMTIGMAVDNEGLTRAGAFIFPLPFFWSGLFNGKENTALRVTLIATGGLFVAAAYASPTALAFLR